MKKKKRLVLLFCVLGFSILLASIFDTVEVIGFSMEPTYHNRDWLLFIKPWITTISPGDVVVVVDPEGDLVIKRIRYIKDGEAFLVGDNLNYSDDSREYGTISVSNIQGKILFGKRRSQ